MTQANGTDAAGRGSSAQVAELNDLLQLDHDAVQAYGLAIRALTNHRYRATLARFRADHERHIADLTALIRRRGGVPVQLPHLPTGVFKLAVQALGATAGDRETLLAFKANERQVRDKYQRAAERAQDDPTVGGLLRTAAGDEARHYDWVTSALDELGAGASTGAGRMEQAAEVAHARVADVVEGAGTAVMRVGEDARRGLQPLYDAAKENPVAAVILAAGAGLLASTIFGDRRGPPPTR